MKASKTVEKSQKPRVTKQNLEAHKGDKKVQEEKQVVAKKSKMSERFAEKEEQPETGLVYVGHLPYGFVEEGLKDYFTQYGKVLRVKLMRSKKTARSKGYCFIEFEDVDVAKIAANSMNGYIMYGRPLDVRYVENTRRNRFQLVRSQKKFKFVPWQIIYKNALNNAEKSDEQVKKSIQNLIESDKKKAERLKELGIKYDFVQYKDL